MIWPLLRTRRWLGFTALVVGVIIAFGLLSQWQWSRAEDRREERVALQAAIDRDPVAVDTLDLSDLEDGQWRAVTAIGVYSPELSALVRKRPLDARNGFWLMTALRLDDGRTIWVNRGWLPAGQDALSSPDLPEPPPGQVTISGYLRAFEDVDPEANAGLPAGQVAAPAAELLPSAPDTVPAYIQLATSDPEQEGLVTLPLPDIDEGRNISYAIQWLLFAAVAMAGWYFFLQREAKEDADRAAAARTQASEVR